MTAGDLATLREIAHFHGDVVDRVEAEIARLTQERDEANAECASMWQATKESARRAEAAERALAESEAYANEGWDWLSEALDALGAKTVFDIKDRAHALADTRDLLRRIREWDALNPLPDPIPAPFGDLPYWVREVDRALAAGSAPDTFDPKHEVPMRSLWTPAPQEPTDD